MHQAQSAEGSRQRRGLQLQLVPLLDGAAAAAVAATPLLAWPVLAAGVTHDAA